jgi:hypothetical protein
MGNIQSNIYNFNLFNFEKVQEHIKNKSIIINTLESTNNYLWQK